MDDVTMRMPLRLVPRKSGQVFKILFFTFFFGFAVFWTTMAATTMSEAPGGNEPIPGFRYFFPAFGIPFMLVGLFGLGTSVLKLLPKSPYYHVELGPDGIRIRKPFQDRRFAWSALSPFDVSIKVRRSKGGKITTYWVVALKSADAEFLADERERYKRSILQINTGEYVNTDVENAASVLADWLNDLRKESLEHPNRAGASIVVPPDFRDTVREIAPGARVSAPKMPARQNSGVIER